VLANEANDPQIISLLHAGAQGCVQKDAGEETLLQAIRDVAADKAPISSNVASELLKYLRNQKDPGSAENTDEVMLSHRELMVLRLMAEGLPNKVIGAQLDISERTVEAHVRNILKKLNASNRTQAAFLASKYGWLVTQN
jgi:DNA-binding NarL/FixJ family response regulator